MSDFHGLATFFKGFLSAVWSLFSIESPIFGLSFGTVTVGIFVVSISLRLLPPLLGMGGNAAFVALHAPSRMAKSRASKRSSSSSKSSKSSKSNP